MATFWQLMNQFWQFLIPTSGHTGHSDHWKRDYFSWIWYNKFFSVDCDTNKTFQLVMIQSILFSWLWYKQSILSGLRRLRERQKIRTRLRIEKRPERGLFPERKILPPSVELVVQQRDGLWDDGLGPEQQPPAFVLNNWSFPASSE